MRDLLRKYLGMLKLELEDLEAYLLDLLEACQRKKDNGKITNYVYLENKGLLLREIEGLRSLRQSMDSLDTAKFSSSQDMFREIDRRIREMTQEGDFPEAVYSLVKRRLNKIVQYPGD